MRDRGAPRADYIVVGGGSAGAVVASRLSEDPAKRVLLLEAGGRGRDILVEMPVGFMKMIGAAKYDWAYRQDPDPSLDGRTFVRSAGKMLGGGSSLNGQVFIRGTDRDFDHWAAMGATGWDYRGVAPYFRRMESWSGPADQARGAAGPQAVSPLRSPHPLTKVFVAACREFGLPTLEDYNSTAVEGAFFVQASQRDGRRCSTEKGYLREALRRPNLEVLTDAKVERLLIDNGRATGVVVVRGGVREEIFAGREIIVSCGAMGTPALLMRSGVGPAAHLKARGVPVVLDLPGVGDNLQEHPAVAVTKHVNRPTLNSQTGPLHMVRNVLDYYLRRRGPMASPALQGMAYARTRPDLAEPDVILGFSPLAFDTPADATQQNFAEMPKQPGVLISTFVCHPESRGRVELDDDLQPHINHPLLGHPDDMAALVRAMKLIERVFRAPSLAAVVTGARAPDPTPQTEDEWEAFARSKVAPAFHAAGTCRMGSDEGAVVDPQLRVRGVAGLRVADASIMPRLPSGNINAPTIMIGEKAADLIAG